ncbi:MAG: CusA/CzcA family heavy metal efflux RND transporter [Thermodesulfovibrionales bacterium]|jgi:cobalt-zinc-cadmium resistance protein CzcA
MIQYFIDLALRRKLLVLGIGLLLFIWGIISFHRLPVEAYPDVADKSVWVITQWPGRAAEEVEQQITIPIETQLNGIGHLTHLRSISLLGLSYITVILDDKSDNLQNRQQVLEKLTLVTLPPNISPQIGPDYSPVGQIYWYTLESTNPQYDIMELKRLQDWVVFKHLMSVPDVAAVSSFGGETREYQVLVDPNKLISHGLSIAQVEQALTANNVNAGGSFIEKGQQAFNVRVIGLMQNPDDIGCTVLKVQNGAPVRVRDIAIIAQGPKIRLGRLGKAIHHEDGRIIDNDDVVEGIVQMRKGAEAESILAALHEKVKYLNERVLPSGVKIVPYLDRDDLVHYTTHTVLRNLTEGIILVVIVLFLFLGNARSALIVAMTMPFSFFFASILLDLSHIPANLLSLGALDFGMLVDGTVVMVENILRHLEESKESTGKISETIQLAAHEVQRPVFFARAIIIISYIPIFTLQRVEGRLFHPMAWTVCFALLGALFFALLLAPALASYLFRRRARAWRNPVLAWLMVHYPRALERAIERRSLTLGIGAVCFVLAAFLGFSGVIGSEFLPHLDEGAIWARGTLPPSIGPSEANRIMGQARLAFARFSEVTQVVCQVGRPDDGTDATGFFNTEYFIDLKPRDRWRKEFHENKEELIEALSKEVGKIPGVEWGFSQPIADNMEEAVSGVKGELAVKVFGSDLKDLEQKSEEIVEVMSKVRGIEDLGIFRVLGQPNVNLTIDRARADRFGINVADVQDAIETAVGGKTISQILKGEERFDLVVRYQEPYRKTVEDIATIRILAPSGERVSLGELCDIKVGDGASMIDREGSSRYIAIKYSVRGRALGSTVEEAMQKVNETLKLPEGYYLDWAGEYESQKRANARLAVIVPVTVLLILLLLFTMFNSFKWSFLVLLTVGMASFGGLLSLFVTGTHFSVSSGIGLLALFGVSVETGVIMVQYINQLRARGLSVREAAIKGATLRLRPIMMTMLVATLGLLPAAMSHDIGSDSQRPFAIVIVGGLITTLILSVFLLPTLYIWIAKSGDILPKPEGDNAQ